MGSVFGGGGDGGAAAARADARKREQAATEEETRTRQKAERTGGRGRDMLVGRLNKVLPTNLGGTQ